MSDLFWSGGISRYYLEPPPPPKKKNAGKMQYLTPSLPSAQILETIKEKKNMSMFSDLNVDTDMDRRIYSRSG